MTYKKKKETPEQKAAKMNQMIDPLEAMIMLKVGKDYRTVEYFIKEGRVNKDLVEVLIVHLNAELEKIRLENEYRADLHERWNQSSSLETEEPLEPWMENDQMEIWFEMHRMETMPDGEEGCLWRCDQDRDAILEGRYHNAIRGQVWAARIAQGKIDKASYKTRYNELRVSYPVQNAEACKSLLSAVQGGFN